MNDDGPAMIARKDIQSVVDKLKQQDRFVSTDDLSGKCGCSTVISSALMAIHVLELREKGYEVDLAAYDLPAAVSLYLRMTTPTCQDDEAALQYVAHDTHTWLPTD